MSDALPQPLVEYALRILAERSPAFLLVAKSGEILEWGGNLESYGIGGLEQGTSVEASVPWLTGTLPLESDAVVMPFVTIREGVVADVHLVPGESGDWVLFLDASSAARYQTIGQQAGNELALLREAYERLRAEAKARKSDQD